MVQDGYLLVKQAIKYMPSDYCVPFRNIKGINNHYLQLKIVNYTSKSQCS